jgi:hypothetical protein
VLSSVVDSPCLAQCEAYCVATTAVVSIVVTIVSVAGKASFSKSSVGLGAVASARRVQGLVASLPPPLCYGLTAVVESC